MTKADIELQQRREKIVKGLELAFQRLLEFKRQKKTPLVLSVDGEIVEVNPDDIKR